jgi:hypothetical protein
VRFELSRARTFPVPGTFPGALDWPVRMIAADAAHAWVAFWRTLTKQWFDSYRPERHYMRGPGPKWREKHVRATGTRR